MKRRHVHLHSTIVPILALAVFTASSGFVQSYSNRALYSALRQIEDVKFKRIQALEDFFEGYNSPLKSHARTFVDVADKYGMDYRLLPAISCMESTCGKFLIEESYNPFGWGIYGSNAIYFESYDQAIEIVGEGLTQNYLSKGFNTPAKIAPIYTPPNHYNWLSGVRFFMNEIDESYVDLST